MNHKIMTISHTQKYLNITHGVGNDNNTTNSLHVMSIVKLCGIFRPFLPYLGQFTTLNHSFRKYHQIVLKWGLMLSL
jgi:hypothetical protein